MTDIEARHDTTGVRVAIKIINKRKMKNKHMISKVQIVDIVGKA